MESVKPSQIILIAAIGCGLGGHAGGAIVGAFIAIVLALRERRQEVYARRNRTKGAPR